MVTEVLRNSGYRGTVGTEVQRNSGYRGTVGTEVQRNSVYRGTAEQWPSSGKWKSSGHQGEFSSNKVDHIPTAYSSNHSANIEERLVTKRKTVQLE
ncbi:hypothetical protein P5673_031507, partial [Acropora cervicornis]